MNTLIDEFFDDFIKLAHYIFCHKNKQSEFIITKINTYTQFSGTLGKLLTQYCQDTLDYLNPHEQFPQAWNETQEPIPSFTSFHEFITYMEKFTAYSDKLKQAKNKYYKKYSSNESCFTT